MRDPDFAGATAYALRRLAADLPAPFVYHSLAHTRDEVVPAVDRITTLERVTGLERRLVRLAAHYHDVGFVAQAAHHELAGIRIARQVLPQYGFDPEMVRTVSGLIWATRLPQRPQTLLESILADADLDVLGRPDFCARNDALRAETTALGRPTTDDQWCRAQLAFLERHRYFTDAARRLRDAQKRKNITLFAEQCRAQIARATAGGDDARRAPVAG
jgi:uncharacterized protein